MIQTLTRNWWLLALCGVFDATASALYFIMQSQDGPMTFHSWRGPILFLGALILAAGACTVAAGLWRSAKGRCWLLVLNGLALVALALIYEFLVRYRVSFLTVALLIILMAVNAGILEVATAIGLLRQRHVADGWLLGLAGVTSAGFAVVFLALGLRWITVEPGSRLDLLWLGAYFGFSAICMLGLGLRLNSLRGTFYRVAGSASPA